MSSSFSGVSPQKQGELPDGGLSFVSPGYSEWKTIEVQFGQTANLEDYAEVLVNILKSHHTVNFSFSVDDVVAYLRTIIGLRIYYVSQRRNHPDYIRNFVIPSYLAQYIQLIGESVNEVMGVELKPVYVGEMMDPKRFADMSVALRVMSIVGLGFTTQAPKDRTGDWAFMMMSNDLKRVESYEQTPRHVAYALAASLVGMSQLDSIFNPVIKYAPMAAFKSAIPDLL